MTSHYHLLTYLVSYLLFFSLLWFSNQYRGNRLLDERGIVLNHRLLIALHIGGIFLLGVFSFSFLNQGLSEIVLGKTPVNNLQAFVSVFLVIIAIVIAQILAEKKYHAIRINKHTNSFNSVFITNYFFVRIVFLCVYETWFRGYLLTDSIKSVGIPFAIVINIFLYAGLHFVNGKQEMSACIPIGILLCSLCIWTGAAWPAILVHVAMAVSYEVHLVRRINKSSISFV